MSENDGKEESNEGKFTLTQVTVPKDTEKMQKGVDLVEFFLTKADDGTLDIYEVTSFTKSWFNLFRCWLCIAIQLVGVPLVLASVWQTSEKSWCQMSDKYIEKILSFLLCLYINFVFWNFYFVIDHPSNLAMRYFDDSNEMLSCANTWYIAGMYINTIALFSTSVSGILIIYNSGTAVDIILNSLAIGFINEIDDLIVSKGDSKKVSGILTEEKDSFKGLKDIPKFWMFLQICVVLPPLCLTCTLLGVSPVWIAVCF